jgi:phosphoglycolate phosphatase
MAFKLVVFDFDGTLADSLAATVAVFNRLAGEMGFAPLTDPAAARHIATRQFLKRHGISFWRLPRVVRRFRALAAEGAGELKLFAGIPEALAALMSGGAKLGVLSSNAEGTIRTALRANGADGHFAFVVGYPRLFGKGKALKRIVRAERVERSDVLYVGDEVRDIEAAQRAGVKSAAVTWGFHAAELLRAANPDFVLDSPGELALRA